MEGETKCRTMLQLCIIVSPPPWRWKHASHPDPNRGTPRTGFEWTNPALNGSSLAFSKVYSRSIFFLETRCNHWDFTVWWRETLQGWGRAMAKSSAFPMGSNETFHRKIQTKDALQHKSYAQLANYGYIYIYTVKELYMYYAYISLYFMHYMFYTSIIPLIPSHMAPLDSL